MYRTQLLLRRIGWLDKLLLFDVLSHSAIFKCTLFFSLNFGNNTSRIFLCTSLAPNNPLPILKIDESEILHPVRKAPWGVSIKEQKKSMFNALLFKKHPELYKEKIRSHFLWMASLTDGRLKIQTCTKL